MRLQRTVTGCVDIARPWSMARRQLFDVKQSRAQFIHGPFTQLCILCLKHGTITGRDKTNVRQTVTKHGPPHTTSHYMQQQSQYNNSIVVRYTIRKICRLVETGLRHADCPNPGRRRRRFRVGTKQRSWTRPVAWELIPMTALWAGEGGAQLSQHTAQVGQKPTGSVCLQSWPQGLLLRRTRHSSLAMALTIASTHFTIPQRAEGWVDLVGWLRTVDSHPSKY